jgi:Protein of unknown function (DUF3102)
MSEGVIRLTGISHVRETGLTWAKNKLPPRDEEADRRIRAALLTNEIARVVALGEGMPATFFDYGDVAAENRDALQKLTKNLKAAVGRHLKIVVEIGEGLLAAKELLGHGNFSPWLQAEFRWSERTARNYMTIAAHLRGKTANFAELDQTTALALIAAPAEVRGPIMRRAEAGESITREEVKAVVRTSKLSDGEIEIRRQFMNYRTLSPPSPTLGQSAERPTGEPPPPKVWTSADFLAVAEKSAGTEIVRDFGNIAYQLRGRQNADKLVERLSAPERDEIRRGVEAVLRIKAALDKLHRRDGRRAGRTRPQFDPPQ